MTKKHKKKLPQEIIPLKNADKTFHENWKKGTEHKDNAVDE